MNDLQKKLVAEIKKDVDLISRSIAGNKSLQPVYSESDGKTRHKASVESVRQKVDDLWELINSEKVAEPGSGRVIPDAKARAEMIKKG